MQLYSLGIKMKVVQNVISMSDSQYVSKSISQYVSMSIGQNATFQLRYQNESCSEYLRKQFPNKPIKPITVMGQVFILRALIEYCYSNSAL